MLDVQSIRAFYGKMQILNDVSLKIGENEIVCLLGRNGAGKSTTLRSIMGLTAVKAGTIKFRGRDITREPTHRRSKMGIGYIPEDRGLLPKLTVFENLLIPARATNACMPEGVERALELFPALKAYLGTQVGRLSGGEQQMVALARGLVGKKTLLLLDEPFQGLMPTIVDDLVMTLQKLKKETSILLVEQNISKALDLADRTYIMKDGTIVFEGKPKEVRENTEVQDLLVLA